MWKSFNPLSPPLAGRVTAQAALAVSLFSFSRCTVKAAVTHCCLLWIHEEHKLEPRSVVSVAVTSVVMVT